MPEAPDVSEIKNLRQSADTYSWYHSIDLGHGVVTPGFYDHRPYLDYYGLPKDLHGRRVLDIGAASGFFTFELERRGADVTATELPSWLGHDFGPLYQPDMNPEQAERYLHGAFEFASQALRSGAHRQKINIYDINPQSTGTFDLVFCGSVLLHLTDPIRALWRIQSVTREAAILVTAIQPIPGPEPMALFIGQRAGDGWWLPNRFAFEAMVQCAGFQGWEWFSEFRLDYRNGQAGAWHTVLRAWNTPHKPALLEDTDQPVTSARHMAEAPDLEISRLQKQLKMYERMKCVRFMRWLHPYRQKLVGLVHR